MAWSYWRVDGLVSSVHILGAGGLGWLLLYILGFHPLSERPRQMKTTGMKRRTLARWGWGAAGAAHYSTAVWHRCATQYCSVTQTCNTVLLCDTTCNTVLQCDIQHSTAVWHRQTCNTVLQCDTDRHATQYCSGTQTCNSIAVWHRQTCNTVLQCDRQTCSTVLQCGTDMQHSTNVTQTNMQTAQHTNTAHLLCRPHTVSGSTCSCIALETEGGRETRCKSLFWPVAFVKGRCKSLFWPVAFTKGRCKSLFWPVAFTKGRWKKKKRQRERMCVCVCVCVIDREGSKVFTSRVLVVV